MRDKINNWGKYLGLGLVLGIIFWANRWIFKYKFEPTYWENYYYHSQWNIPQSTRVIGDEGVYRYIGYRYVNGENPFNVDYWVPPLGKYLYGLSAKYLGNPYITSVLIYLGCLLVTWLIAKETIRERKWLALSLAILSPMLAAQTKVTMLDIVQAFFLLWHVYWLIKNRFWLSGVALGAMAGIKIGLFVPLVGLISGIYLWRKAGFKKGLWLVVGMGMGYVLAYFCYFIQHPNPIPWLRLHEKIWIFWQGSGSVVPDVGRLLRFVFFNRFRGYWEGSSDIITTEWSPVLPLGILLLIPGMRDKNREIKYMSWLAAAWVALNGLIAFWPRYLVPIMPIICIITAYYWGKRKLQAWVLIIVSVPFLIINLRVSPKETATFFARQIETRAYSESYRQLTAKNKMEMTEDSWIEKNRKIEKALKIEETKAEIKLDKWSFWQNDVWGNMTLTFKTRSGDKKYDDRIHLINEDGAWKVEWQWKEIKEAEVSDTGKMWRFIWIVPEQIQNWPETISEIAKATGMTEKAVWKKIQLVVPDKYPTEIGWIRKDISPIEYYRLIKNNAIRIERRKNGGITDIWTIPEDETVRWLML